MRHAHRNYLYVALTICIWLAGSALSANAIGPGAAQAGKSAAAPASSLVQPVHGCHFRPRIGPFSGLSHRHVGPGCRWVRARRRGPGFRNPCRRWRRVCSRRCFDARFPRRCFNRCYDFNAPRFCG